MPLIARFGLPLNISITTLVLALAAHIYIGPHMAAFAPEDLFIPILLIHALRHIGLMFLAPGVVLQGMPRAFAVPAALGDLITALLALTALTLLLNHSPYATIAIWAFNVVGLLDLLVAITQAARHRAASFMGAAYWIPAMCVPVLLVTHGLVFIKLIS